jgi:transposase
MARRTTKITAVALASKTARMVWAIMTSGESYREPELRAAAPDKLGKGDEGVM